MINSSKHQNDNIGGAESSSFDSVDEVQDSSSNDEVFSEKKSLDNAHDRDEADAWGTSHKNYYHEDSEPSSSESDEDFAIEEALLIRKKHLENLKSIKIDSAINLVDSNETEEQNVDKNTQEVHLSLLLDALSNMSEKPVAKTDFIEDKCLIEAEKAFNEIVNICLDLFVPLLICEQKNFFKLSSPADCFAKIVLKGACLASMMLSAKQKINIKSFAVEWVKASLAIKKVLHLMNKYFLQDELQAARLVCDAFFEHGNVSYIEKTLSNDNETRITSCILNDDDPLHNAEAEISNFSSEGEFSSVEKNSDLSNDEDLNIIVDEEKKLENSTKPISKDFKAHLYRVKQLSKLPVLPQMITDPNACRNLTREIEKNRGLTRKRKKFSGNARVHNREKFRRKLIKLSGVRMKADEQMGSGEYTGESRGISMHVTRGRMFT